MCVQGVDGPIAARDVQDAAGESIECTERVVRIERPSLRPIGSVHCIDIAVASGREDQPVAERPDPEQLAGWSGEPLTLLASQRVKAEKDMWRGRVVESARRHHEAFGDGWGPDLARAQTLLPAACATFGVDGAKGASCGTDVDDPAIDCG